MDTPSKDANVKKRTTPHKTPSKRGKLENLPAQELTERYNELLKKEKELTAGLSVYADKCVNSDLNAEMQALHRYNDMKDFAQVVLGYLSDIENTTVTELHSRYNLPRD